jgi:serine/threonine protein kinase/tetratricopeptide (TPR) repeat protein
MPDPVNLGQLPAPEWNRLQELAERFEEACREQGTADLAVFLPPPDDPLRPIALHELIKTDLEMRWRRGRGLELEAYLTQFPELGTPETLPASLLHEEFLVRHAHGDWPPLAIYERRFPRQFPELRRLVEGDPPAPHTPGSSLSDSPTPGPNLYRRAAPGEVLPVGSGYKLLERIGSGGFGEVWRAEAPGGIGVAVKIIVRPADDRDVRREIEALELARRLRHPFLLLVQAFWVLPERVLVLMELADANLRQRQRICQELGLPGIPAPELLAYFREAAEALDYLHSQHVQHRDVKPDNILLVGRHAKLADFGLLRGGETRGQISVSGSGTPAYMAPEVWRGQANPASDQYSLATAYAELRLQRVLFTGSDWVQVMAAHISAMPNLAPLGPHEQSVLLRALAKDPAERFPSCLVFVQELESAVAQDAERPISSIHDAPTAAREQRSELVGEGESGTLPLVQLSAESDSEARAIPEGPAPANAVVDAAVPAPQPRRPESSPEGDVNWLPDGSEMGTSPLLADAAYQGNDAISTAEPAAPIPPQPLPPRQRRFQFGLGVALAVGTLSVVVGAVIVQSSRSPSPFSSQTKPGVEAEKPAAGVPRDGASAPAARLFIDADSDGHILEGILPEAPEAVSYKQALACFERRDYAGAIEALTAALQVNQKFALAYKNRGYAHYLRGEYDPALADLNIAIKLNPQFFKAHGFRGRIYAIYGDTRAALSDFSEVLKFDSNNTLYLMLRATVCMRTNGPNRQADVFADVDQIIKLEPLQQSSVQAYNLRGQIYTEQGKHALAAADFEQAVKLKPDFGPLYAGRAQLHVAEGEYAAAIEDYTRAIELNPSEERNYCAYRAEAYRLQGKPEMALQDLAKASKRLPRTLNTRGLIHAARGELDKAIRDFSEALQYDARNVEALRNRAAAYRKQNQPQKAEADEEALRDLLAPASQP